MNDIDCSELRLGRDPGTTFPVQIASGTVSTLVDTGALRSVMSEAQYLKLGLPPLDTTRKVHVVGAGGMDLESLGHTKAPVVVGNASFEQEFIVCRQLKRPAILGIDFTRENSIGIQWTDEGKRQLLYRKKVLIELDDPAMGVPLRAPRPIRVPPRHTLIAHLGCSMTLTGQFETVLNPFVREDHPALHIPPLMLTGTEARGEEQSIPVPIINLDNTQGIEIEAGEVLAFARPTLAAEAVDIYEVAAVQDIIDEMVEKSKKPVCRHWIPARRANKDAAIADIAAVRQMMPAVPKDTAFLCSPADVDQHRKVELQDAAVSQETREKFRKLCEEHPQVFSQSNTDIGTTQLLKMDILTGDSPPINQKPYTLPLKHYDWVKKEIETLEKAGVIEHSVSPWASPIVVVPKKSAPNEPPRRRLCIDFRKLNALQPETKRVDINQRPETKKTPLTLHPLPKIDDIFARLNGAKVFSTLDLRSGYYHIALSEDSRPKTAFVTPFGKWEFCMVPFGLSQAPAYFQLLISMVLEGLDFAIGYLDDIIIFSKTEEEHMKHMETVFERLEAAGLKLKRSKCEFFKKHIHYLGHLISDEGIAPLPEKLDSIRHMPCPTSAKEVKQFLGLVGYYRKFVPRFADISRPLTQLTVKDRDFVWKKIHKDAFNLLKQKLCEAPILVYPDPNHPYTLYTDASKYAWGGVLTQEHVIPDVKGIPTLVDLPVAYVSGLFRGSQLNWAALTKEAHAIYMSVRKLDFYLCDADILLRSDHLPLKRFLEKNTLNAKVNNWAVELETYRIEFRHIAGAKNRLADTLSRLIQIDPTYALEPEKPGYEFGYAVFDPLAPAATVPTAPAATIEVSDICPVLTRSRSQSLSDNSSAPTAAATPTKGRSRPTTPNPRGKGEEREGLEPVEGPVKKETEVVPMKSVDPDAETWPDFFNSDPELESQVQKTKVDIPKEMEDLKRLQMNDERCRSITRKMSKARRNKTIFAGVMDYRMREGILYRVVRDQAEAFEAIVIPKSLIEHVMTMAHDHSGHNGAPRTYMAVRRVYYWKGMKADIRQHVKRCASCQKYNVTAAKYTKNLHYRVPTAPMQFIAMDLIGEFHPPTSRGNRYAFTVIDMLTGYTWCIPIPDKKADTIVKAYTEHVWAKFGGSAKIISDNGTEFKNKTFEEVCRKLGVEAKLYTTPYRPQSNGRIEGFHRFLKACIGKHIAGDREWDEIAPLATSAYNFFPNEHSKESAFFLMFGRDPLVPLTTMLQDRTRYLGDNESMINLEALHNVHQVAAEQIRKSRERHGTQINTSEVPRLNVGDSVMVRDPVAKGFQPKYKPAPYRVVSLKGKNVVLLKGPDGKKEDQHISKLKKVDMSEYITEQVRASDTFGRQAKLRLNKDAIPDLQWELSASKNTSFNPKQEAPSKVKTEPHERPLRQIAAIEEEDAVEVEEIHSGTLTQRLRELALPSPCSICTLHGIDYTVHSRRTARRGLPIAA